MKLWSTRATRASMIGLALAATLVSRADTNRNLLSGELAEYIARPDPDFGWIERSTGRLGPIRYVELTLVSQEWRGVTWKHQLFIVRPSRPRPNVSHAMLVVAGSRWKDEFDEPPINSSLPKSAPMYVQLAERLGAPVAVLLQVPFQPMFDNLTEDWLIAYTFEKYLETGESDWPLLLPMVKSCVRAMDAVQGFTKTQWGMDIETFTVTGASKRGWTTWLTGAADKRATAIAPMVIDVLNMAPHMKLAREVWGAPSNKVEPYTRRGLLDRLASPEGRQLLGIVDPYSYRDVLDQPKLIINGTNDDYWVTDATNLYWDDLRGEKRLLYVPNNDHGLDDHGRVIGGVLALHEHQAGRKSLPEMTWTFGEDPRRVTLAVEAPQAEDVRVWVARSPIADLRKATWISQPLVAENGQAKFTATRSGEYQAFFIEAEFRQGRSLPLYLSTNMRILPPAGGVHAASQ